MKHVIKCYSFLNRNPDLPFVMKKRLAEACVMSTLLCGCKTWFCTTYGNLERLYMRIIKALLSVRDTTCTELCLFESGMPSLKARINVKRKTFLNQKFKMLADDDPLKIAFNLVKENKTNSYQIIKEAITLQNETNDIIERANLLRNNATPKRVIYWNINPSLVFHPIYTTCIPEIRH